MTEPAAPDATRPLFGPSLVDGCGSGSDCPTGRDEPGQRNGKGVAVGILVAVGKRCLRVGKAWVGGRRTCGLAAVM